MIENASSPESPSEASETLILADIERLRGASTDTKSLYREVASLLFFRYGITPTANRLYQLVRRGSMATPAQALAKFWEDLRTRSHLRIEHPDLPEEIRTLAGDLVAGLWGEAQKRSREDLDAFRAEAGAEAADARSRLDEVLTQAERAAAETERLKAEVTAMRSTGEELSRALASEKSLHASAREQLRATEEIVATITQQIEDARQEHQARVEELRQAMEQARAGYEALERRALNEIDQARTEKGKIEKDLERARASAAAAADRERASTATMQDEIATLREQLGRREAELAAAIERCWRGESALEEARRTAVDAQAHAAALSGEGGQMAKRLEDLVKANEEFRERLAAADPGRRKKPAVKKND